MLKFKKAEVKQQRLKLLVFGEMGSGKSTISCAMPNVAYIDTEDTTSKEQYAQAVNDNGGAVMKTGDIDEIILQVKELMTSKHPFTTLVIDSLTIPYEKYARLMERKVGSDFGKNTNEAEKKINDLVALLLDEKFDMNVIVTAHSKRDYGSNMSVIGNMPLASKRLGHMFDLVLETSVVGRNFIATVRKSRLKSFVTGEEVKFNYEEIVKRCGVETLEKPVAPVVVELPIAKATTEQLVKIMAGVKALEVTEKIIDAWFEKEGVKSFEEMNTVTIEKYIAALAARMKEKENGDSKI